MQVYVAVGKLCWGRGATKAAAREQARYIGGPPDGGRWAYYRVTVDDEESVYVDQLGSLHGPEWEHVGGPDVRVR